MQLLLNDQKIEVEIANNIFTQSIGLMFKKHLKPNHGVLFVFPMQVKLSFWMIFTFISLDILWIDKNKKIVDITKGTLPWSKKDWLKVLFLHHAPKKSYKYALEVNAGFAQKNNIKIGDKIVIY